MSIPKVSLYSLYRFSTNGAVLQVRYRFVKVPGAITTVQKSIAKWIDFLYGPFFKVAGFFYRVYTTNRARVEAIKSNAKVSAFLKLLAVLVLVGWILTWFFASDESRTRLVDDVKQSIGILDQESAQ